VFTMFLPSPLHSPCALMARYKRWLNKVLNLSIHGWFCSQCLIVSYINQNEIDLSIAVLWVNIWLSTKSENVV